MKTLIMAPPAEWREFDKDLSFKIRRITLREICAIIEGTHLQAIMEKPAADGDGESVVAQLPLSELLDLAEKVVDRMISDWTVQDQNGDQVPVDTKAAQWLMSQVPGLPGWLVFSVLCAAINVEGAVEEEKKH